MWMMDLSREFYEQIGKPALEAAVPVLSGRYAAGLVGCGSECFGFDDEISAEHDHGPGVCVRVTKREYEKVLDYALELGISNGFFQEGETARESFIPLFDYEGL